MAHGAFRKLKVNRKTRNALLAELTQEAWHHAITGQQLLKRIRELEAYFWHIDAIEDKTNNIPELKNDNQKNRVCLQVD
jgi:hypothetical protein